MRSKLISIRSASELLGVCETTVRTAFDKKKIRGFKTPGGQRRLFLRSVETYKARREKTEGIILKGVKI
jgi:excisionase family DNA binding protein